MPHRPTPSIYKPLKLSDDEILLLDHLPKQPKHPPTTDHDAFAVPMNINLVEPSSLVIKHNPHSGGQRAAMERAPRLLCSQHTTVYISPSHTIDQLRDQLATHAQSALGVNATERWRWACTVVTKCDDIEDVLREENREFLISASEQGGWAWQYYLVELERSQRGVWESRSFVRVE